jgi:uncharacterized protein (DUF1810 family)
MKEYDLSRYIQMHKQGFKIALHEVKSAKKSSHWMWYIFPQIYGLGWSPTSKYYAIKSADEARAFLNDPYLNDNITQICKALLELESNNATEIFGRPDDIKLKSSMTLFAYVSEEDSIFHSVLKKFFNGKPDNITLNLL